MEPWFEGKALEGAPRVVRSTRLIKNGPQLRQAREALGWSELELARALRLAGDDKQGKKRILEMEAGARDISGPVTVAIESFLHGFLPHDFGAS